MKIEDFRKMFFTAYGRINSSKVQTIFNMLIPIIKPSHKDMESEEDQLRTKFGSSKQEYNEAPVEDRNKFVSISKLSKFIDYFNYVPLNFNELHHKNDTSEDLYLYMGK